MGFFSRMFKIGQSEAHSALDRLEDPIKLTEQGIRDLKKDLGESMKGLAEVKAIAIRMQRDGDQNRQTAADYEKKAMLLLERGKSGQLEPAQAERLALEALTRKEEAAGRAVEIEGGRTQHDQMVAKMQANVSRLKSKIGTYENELVTLRARYRTAKATGKLNRQLAQIDSSGTISMLEKMRDKVNENEALAEAYGDVATVEQSVDDEINKALSSGDVKTAKASDSLAALKAKMGV